MNQSTATSETAKHFWALHLISWLSRAPKNEKLISRLVGTLTTQSTLLSIVDVYTSVSQQRFHRT